MGVQTVWDHVRLAADRTPDRIAVVDDKSDSTFTFASLIQEVESAAAGLAEIGVEPGQYVATILPNVLQHVISILALHRLGAVVCMINPRLKPNEAKQLIVDAKMSGVICSPNDEIVKAAVRSLPHGAPILVVGDAEGSSSAFEMCRADPSLLPDWKHPDPETVAFILYTSGTTGLPKGVMIPHRATDSRVLFAPVQCGLRHGIHNKALGLMPLFHAVGFYSSLVTTLSLNGTYYVHSAFDPPAAVEAIKTQGITYVFGAPAHFYGMLGVPGFVSEDMSSVETLAYAGAVMPAPLLKRVKSAFPNAEITNIYGTTEVMNALYMPNPVGRPLQFRPGFYSNVRVVRIGGVIDDVCGTGEEGELIVDASADATFLGYLNRPEATAEKLTRGWYWTGDIVFRRQDGDLELCGRVDDMIVSGGENIHPEEVETVLMQHEAVREVAVIGVPDDQWSERVVACVVGQGVDHEALDAWCRDSVLANYKRPREYAFLDSIPRNAANKVLRRELKEVLRTR
ncbi:MAG: 4-chlorobenzoate--CoA ligase [Alphaproteobacteria bacterium MarineAlpha11_Bin1]|nr:MAG: 4-chlorobenzoate--CoA ligase [Alphaproteobacteria bacterium MarineAlpha11_Bin1]|tara:strand:- start:1766 stop:3301 length:1536 start_codon:yes stop_codon:yes gene_type:complete